MRRPFVRRVRVYGIEVQPSCDKVPAGIVCGDDGRLPGCELLILHHHRAWTNSRPRRCSRGRFSSAGFSTEQRIGVCRPAFRSAAQTPFPSMFGATRSETIASYSLLAKPSWMPASPSGASSTANLHNKTAFCRCAEVFIVVNQ